MLPTKKFNEDTFTVKTMLLRELTGNQELIEEGNGDSSSGSDDAPSEDNMDIDEICQLVPAVDKKLKSALKRVKKNEKKIKKEADDAKAQKKKLVEKAKKFSLQEEEKSIKPVPIKKRATQKPPEKKKPVVVMIDAWTQTENSDLALMKYKMKKRMEMQKKILERKQ